MRRQAIHRVLELLIGVPALVVGAVFIGSDYRIAKWIAADPEHHWGFVGVGTMIGLLPFLIGCWFVSAAVYRMVRKRSHS